MKGLKSGLVIAASLLVLFCVCHRTEMDTQAEGESLVPAENCTAVYDGIIVRPWVDGEEIYLFLPSFFVWDETELVFPDQEASLDGKQVGERVSLADYREDEPYSYREDGQEKQLYIKQSRDVGTVYIETSSGSMEAVDADKEYKESGMILVCDALGNQDYAGYLTQIKGRGNVTWQAEKKSYGIKLSSEADLLGMGAARKWILLNNVYDGTGLRNKLCLDLAKEIDVPFAVEAEWVDLYLNGSYNGNYLLCEKVEIGDNRIAISDSSTSNDIDTGYLLERNSYYDADAKFKTDDGNPFTLSYPKEATEDQLTYIAERVQTIEDLILDGQYEEAGAYLDWDSFFLRYLVDEAVLNQDTGVTSMYFYKDAEDDLLYSGPVWDYDASLGAGSLTSMFNYHVIAGRDLNSYRGDISLSWYSAMYDGDWFQDHVRELYRETVRPYLKTLLEEKIDAYVAQVEHSRELDAIRWRNLDCKTGHYTQTENEIRYLKYFLEKRVSSLDAEWLGEKTEVIGQGDGTTHTISYVSEKGTKLVEAPDGDMIILTPEELLEEGEWWFNERDGQDLTPYLPVFEDVTFKASTGE